MENAVQALKIAFGVLVFVIAITVSFSLFSQAKSTSDIVMYSSDKTNYYTYEENNLDPIVGIDTIISEIYRYCRGESIVIKICKSDGTVIKDFDGTESNYLADAKTFIKDNLMVTYKDSKFIETFEEGQYMITITYKQI